MIRISIVLTCLSIGIWFGPPVCAQEKPAPSELVIVAGQVENATNDLAPILERGKLLIKGSTSIEDDLVYLNAVGKKGGIAEDEQVLSILVGKYQADNSALAQIYTDQAYLYLNDLGDKAKCLSALEKAQQLREKIEVNNALDQLKLWQQSGETYLLAQKPDDLQTSRQKAKDYFQKIVVFPSVAQPYFTRVDDFQKIQIKAALRLVELTDPHEVPQLYLPFFTYEAVYDQFPSKAKLLNNIPPELAKFNRQTANWLDMEVKNQTGDSPILPQLQAVLDWFKKQNHL